MSRIDEALARARVMSGGRTELVTADDVFAAEALPHAAAASFPAETEDASADRPRTARPERTQSPHRAALDSADPTSLALRVEPRLSEKVVIGRIMPESLEQYRRLAATLHHAQCARELKVVMVASAMTGEGKSLTAANLALTLSESYRRKVLLVDADLRRPTLHRLFRLDNSSGLSDGLRAGEASRLPVRQLSDGLAVLTAGFPDADPMSSLTSDRMRLLLHEASETYDWVVLDTPPVGLMPDANLLSAMVGGAVLVVRAGVTPYPLVLRAVDAIGRDRIIGVVLNGADKKLAHDYYYHYPSPAGGGGDHVRA